MDSSLLIAKSVTILLMLLSLLLGCRPQPGQRREKSDGDLAQVTLKSVPGLDYDSFVLSLSPKNGSGFSLSRKIFPAAQGRLDTRVPAGIYRLELDLMKDQKVVASSAACPETSGGGVYTLKSGPNNLDVPVCPPEMQGGGNFNKGFHLVQDQLFDPSGTPFVMRGVNTPHAYYLKESNDSLSRVKELGFNTVRIVWCADNLIRSGRCDVKDVHPLGELEKVLSLVKAQRLVAVLNLQNVTGSDSAQDLQKMVEYLTRPDVKALLLAHKDNVLINVANEWYGTWDKTKNYLQGYRTAITEIRKSGLPHVLIIDARGYGQDVSSIAEHGRELINLDPNLMISAHLYDVFGTHASVANVFSMVRERKLPFIVGEFGCSHGRGKRVACEAILAEASRSDKPYGYIGWSFSGNSSSLQDLDIVELRDWSTLTPWGRTLIHGPGGVKSSAKEACYFRSPLPCKND